MTTPEIAAGLMNADPHMSFYTQILILLGTSTFLILVLQRLRLSPILGYMLGGVLIGPFALGFINDVEALQPLAELGIACLLFIIGLELSLARLKSMRQLVFGLGGLQVVLTALIIAAVTWSIGGQRIFVSALVGFAFALSSTAIVVQLLAERGEVTTKSGRAAFSILLFQDLAAIPLLALTTAGEVPDNAVEVLIAIGKAILALTVIISVANMLSQPLFRRIARTKNNELFTAFTLLVVIGMGFATQLAGLSLALGAFLAGLLLSGTAYRHKIEADIGPFKGLLLGLFFMTVGMNLDLRQIHEDFNEIMGAVLALIVVKGTVLYLLGHYFLGSRIKALRIGFWLSGAGEFALVALQAMGETKLLTEETMQFLLGVAAISLLMTPILNQFDKWWQRRMLRPDTHELQKPSVEIARAPQIFLAGYGRMGEAIGNELRQSNINFIALDNDAERVARAQSRGLPVYFGQADDLNLLLQMHIDTKQAAIVTLDDPRMVTQVVSLLRMEWPKLPLLARAYDSDHARDLQRKGANVTVTETMAASIALSEAAIVLAEVAAEDKAEDILRDILEPAATPEIPDGHDR